MQICFQEIKLKNLSMWLLTVIIIIQYWGDKAELKVR